ncbi:14784_t:CDS:2 [Funneliformis caledonium]|uniref:14784_t:CDS:1 n=1 Tax=Funneliformis caledonium TaxID=1117310 RepID=A0A9N9H8P3_9GLOM|nr:14784_t:CDS:2 [Funneliformis caledonium]
MFSNASSVINVRDIIKKQEEIQSLFTSNCKPTTAHFNIVQRVTVGLSILNKELLLKQKLMEMKKEAVGQPSCNLFKISDSATWNIEDNGQADTSRHHPEDNDIPEIANQLTLARRYRVINIVGEGAFSKTECKKLRYLNLHDVHGNSHTSKLLNTFFFDKHFCLVFEYYRGGVPKISFTVNEQLRLQIIRKLACQLLTALIYIKHMAVIHGDLKLENILFVSENSYDLKVIDFGNAIGLDDVKFYMESFEIQSLIYRAPEVLLGLPFGYEIDMWSFGCIICEIWIGHPIFQSDTKSSIIKEMEQLLGPLPTSIYKPAKNFAWYSTRIDNGLKDWPTGSNEDTLQSMRIRKLSKALNTNNMDFIKFIDEIFNYDSSKRLTPTEALCHKFFAPLFPFALFYANHEINTLLKTQIR